MRIGPLKINVAHVLAFVFGMVGILGTYIGKALEAGQSLNFAMVLTGTGALLWALAQETIFADGTGMGGKSLDGALYPKKSTKPTGPTNLRTPYRSNAYPNYWASHRKQGWLRWPPIPVFFVLGMIFCEVFLPAASCQNTVQTVPPILQKVEQIVLAGIETGETAEQIEADVAGALAGQAGVDVVEIVNAAVTLLIDTGSIPPNFLSAAKILQTNERAKLFARKTKP